MNNIIIACDFDNKKALKKFLKNFGKEKLFLKVGYQLFYKEGRSIIKWLKKKGHAIFLDLKLHDIPNTVGEGVKSLMDLGVEFITIHAAGGVKMMEAAKKSTIGYSTKLLAVTQLTSTSKEILEKELLIKESVPETVLYYARNAHAAGIDGVICSANETQLIRRSFSEKFLVVTPGIRLDTDSRDDQVRITTPSQAQKKGSSYIVVGRPITKKENPYDTYLKFLKEFN